MKKIFSFFAALMLMASTVSATTIYCKMDQSWWTKNGAAVGIYTWDGVGTPKAVWPGERMTPVVGDEGVWSFDLDLETYKMCIFTRVNGEGAIEDWGAKTKDQTIPTDGNNLFTIAATEVWGDPGCEGVWSVYGEDPQSVNPIDHVYFATGNEWAADTESKAEWDAETGKITVTLALPKVAPWQGQIFVNAVKAEPGKCYNFSVKMKSNKSLSGATIKWQDNNDDPIMVSEINTISLTANEEFVYTKEKIAGQDGNGKLVYDFGYAEAGTVIEIYDLVIEETECSEVEHTYTVAGVENVFGSHWNSADENNDMVKQENGIYTWKKEGLALAAGNVEFKVCEDHAWTHFWPAQNYVLPIAEAGVYTISITFDPASEENKVAAIAEKTGEAQIDPTVSIAGSMNEWNAKADVMTLSSDKESASLKMTLDATSYTFKVVLNGSDWRSNAHEFTRENATAAQMTGNDETNLSLIADKAGEYTFTWTFETNTLVIEFPATEGIDNTDAAIKAIKYFENGQLIIEKNGVKFNAQGTIIK